jgi:Ni/Co efflux regulator RcnB
MMQKLVLSIAALAAVAVFVPSVAPAQAEETVVIKKHHRHFMPVEHHHRTVIIKKEHRDHDD